MNRAAVKHFLKLLGARQIDDGGDWVNCSCLFASVYHQSGRDSHPSFGMRTVAGSPYKCFACRAHGPAARLPHALRMAGISVPAGADEIAIDAAMEIDFDDQREEPVPKLHPASASDFLSFPSVLRNRDAAAYLQGRGLHSEVCREYDLRYDSLDQRILLPVWTTCRSGSKFLGAMGRSIVKGRIKYLAYWMKGTGVTQAFFGEHLSNSRRGSAIIVEGSFDALAIAQADAKVLPLATVILGFSLIRAKRLLAMLSDRSATVYVWPDPNKTGAAQADTVIKRLHNRIRTLRIQESSYGDRDPADNLKEGGAVRLFDAMSDALPV